MTPYHVDPWLTVYQGDCREVMAAMEPASVHCVVTSPPYWGLRDYGTATWIGGDEACDHLVGPLASAKTGLQGGHVKDTDKIRTNGMPFRGGCGKCGAIREDDQLGLEPTPEAYVENMVAVFREVRRVLRDDGTVWLNLGDSYSGSGPSGASYESETTRRRAAGNGTDGTFRVSKRLCERGLTYADKKPIPAPGLKPKDLVGIPWRVAFALQADGWYLRSDIIWSKPNPMPESVTDRPTKSHEYLFLLSQSPRYYFDADAVREAHADSTVVRPSRWLPGSGTGPDRGDGRSARTGTGVQSTVPDPAGRNIRSVWTIATAPYPGAHFATFPPKLVEPCIKAGCPVDGTVLDPFAGSGTTGKVAQSLSRRAVLIDLNADYLLQAMARNADIPLGLDVA